jgi:hypothetical protein
VSNLSGKTIPVNADGKSNAPATLPVNDSGPGAAVGEANNPYRFEVTFP